MASETWYSEIESTIYTHLQHVLVEVVDAPYPELNCTTSNRSESLENISDFPNLYVHLLPPAELGNDLTNVTVNGIRATFELQVYSDKSESECREIMTACIQEMKKLCFNVSMFPDPQTASEKKYYALARFTRVIGAGDFDIVPQD